MKAWCEEITENLFFKICYVYRFRVPEKHKPLQKKCFLSQDSLTGVKSLAQRRHKRKEEFLTRDWQCWTWPLKELILLKCQNLHQSRWGNWGPTARPLPKNPEWISGKTALAPQVHYLMKTLGSILIVSSWPYFPNTITYIISFDLHHSQWEK